jgi:hypothetical protein
MGWHALKPADGSVFARAPIVYRFPARLPVPPERVWESLASDRGMWDWDLGVKRLTWTSPRPFGVGTTREVVLPFAAMTVREQFFRWDEGKGYSFYVAETDRPLINQFAEDYVVEPDGDGSLFTWTIALEPKRALLPALRLAGPLTKLAFAQVPRAARKYFARG